MSGNSQNQDLSVLLAALYKDSRFSIHSYPVLASQTPLTLLHVHPQQPILDSPAQFNPIRFGVTFLRSEQDHSISYVRRSAPVFDDYKPIHHDKTHKSKPTKTHYSESDKTLENLLSAIKTGKSIEIIKTEYPHGLELQVSYVAKLNKWVISNDSHSVCCSSQQEIKELYSNLDNQLTEIALFWFSFLKEIEDVEKVTKILKEYTLCGRFAEDLGTVSWYCLVETIPKQGICKDFFDAKDTLENAGLSFVKIKSLGILMGEDQVMRVLENTVQSVDSQLSESIDHKNGRARIYIVNSAQIVIGGFNVQTAEDRVFSMMQTLLLEKVEKPTLFQDQYRKILNESMGKTPYPFLYYKKMFENMVSIVKENDIEAEYIKKRFIKLAKLALYLESKRLSIPIYSSIFYKDEQFYSKIRSVPLQQYGPLNCKIIVIYCFVGLQSGLKIQISEQMSKYYAELDLPFARIDHPESQDFNIGQIAKQINSQHENHLSHYFLIDTPRIFTLTCLQKELEKYTSDDQFFKIILIAEKMGKESIICGNSYPFSMEIIANTYHQALQRKKSARKLEEKAEEMRKVTKNIEALKNYKLQTWKNIIKIDIQMQKQSESVKKAIECVIDSPNDESKHYFSLMLQLDKGRKLQTTWPLQSQINKIISHSYFPVPTFSKHE